MSISRIWKNHRNKVTGETELFVVEPRRRDQKYLVKQLGAKGNRDEVYDKVNTLDEVWDLLNSGRSVRMRGQNSRNWNTLNREGVHHA